MTWTKVCENFYDDPRLMRAGEDAADLHVRAMVYSNRHGTDGFVPRWCISALSRKPTRTVNALVRALVEAGAWVEEDEGWRLEGFHKTQPYAEEVRSKRDALSAARSAAGKAGNMARWGRKHIANASQPDRKPVATDIANASQPDRSDPIRSEEEYPSLTTSGAAGGEDGAQSPEDGPPGGSPVVNAAEVEAALYDATAGALRLSAAPSTQSAAIVRHLRAAGVTREELPYVTAALRDPGSLWDWAKTVKVTAGWLAGKPHPGTHEHDCARLQEVVAHARAARARAIRDDAARAAREAATASHRPVDAASAAAVTDFLAKLAARKAAAASQTPIPYHPTTEAP